MNDLKKISVKNVLNTRLDRFLREQNSILSQSFLEKLLRRKHILLNGKKAFSNTLLKNGDIIEYKKFLDIEFQQINQSKSFFFNTPQIAKFTKKEFCSKIIWMSEEFLAINKSSNVAVQGGSKVKISLQDSLHYLKEKNQKDFKIVHRIDRDTSGILIFANGYINAVKLAKAFKSRLIYKIYLALVENIPIDKEGKIQDYHHYVDSNNIIKNRISISFYKLLANDHARSLLIFFPITGRKHQIRKHSLKIGCPIIGDIKYGSQFSQSNLKLHAVRMDIDYSIFCKTISLFSFPEKSFFSNFKIDKSCIIKFIKNFDFANNSLLKT